ncbi:MAG TPA: 2TM domain-containing protein [Gaiellaceae bacterium]|nr:2TM domain-containing protein [Gaiellaceae bacterium]
MPTETLTRNERPASEAVPENGQSREDEALRKLALRHLERVRKFKLYLSVYVLSMLVLTPVWIVTQYEQADGWLEHLSTRSRYPGDWDPWIIWVALIGAFVVALAAFRAYFDRAETEGEIEREVERLKSKR